MLREGSSIGEMFRQGAWGVWSWAELEFGRTADMAGWVTIDLCLHGRTVRGASGVWGAYMPAYVASLTEWPGWTLLDLSWSFSMECIFTATSPSGEGFHLNVPSATWGGESFCGEF